MTLTIDASSPSGTVATGAVSSITSASFTPPAGSLILAAVIFDAEASYDTVSFSNPSGSLSIWTQVVNYNNYVAGTDQGGLVGFAWASVTSSAATTVRASFGGHSSQGALKVYVFTGANMVSPIGVSNTGTITVNSTTGSYSATATGSISVWGWADGTATDTSGALSATTTDVTATSSMFGKIVHQTTPAASAFPQWFTATGMTSGDAMAYVEIVPSGGAIGGGTGTGGAGGGTLAASPLRLNLGGVNLSQYVTQGDWVLNQDWGRQGDTFQVVLIDDRGATNTPHFVPIVEQQITFTDTVLGLDLFGGVVTSVWLQWDGPAQAIWTLNCVSYSHWADSRVVSYSYSNSSMGSILTNLTQNAACGITTNHVVAGPTITSVSGQFETLSKAWSKITQMASTATTYGWWVDAARDLHVADEVQAQAAGVTFTDVPTAGYLNAEGHYDTSTAFEYIWDGTSMANRVYTVGGNVAYTQTDAWHGDGSRNSFALTYPLDTGAAVAPILKVNGATTVVSTSITDPWVLAQDSVTGLWSLTVGTSTATPIPGSGVPISLTYGYEITQVSVTQNTTSIAQYSALTQMNTNGTFESGTSPWAVFNGTLASSTAQAHSGTHSAQVTPVNGSAYDYILSEQQPATAGTTYTASGWIWCTQAVVNAASVFINWYDSGHNFLGNTFIGGVAVPARQWFYLATYHGSPPNTAYAALGIGLNGTMPSSNVWYADDLVMSAYNNNGGLFDAAVADQGLLTLDAVQQRGSHELAEYAFPQEQVTFNTTADWQGWVNVGQTIQFVSSTVPDSANGYTLGLSKKFLVVSLRAGGVEGGYRTAQITAIRVQQ